MMSIKRFIVAGCIAIAVLMLVAGCGSSSSSSASQVVTSGNTYLVEYVPGTSPATEGKTTFQLKIRKSADGSLATGLTPTLVATMHMTGKSHGAPADVVTETVPRSSGIYNCTMYYLMGDYMMGSLAGYWELEVRIGSETATFYPSVGSQRMMADTWKVTMKSAADKTSNIAYFLFSDGMVSSVSPTFKIYISKTTEANLPVNFYPVSAVSSPTGTVDVVVHVSTDTLFNLAATGVTGTATDDGNGHFSMPGLTALASTSTSTVYVKLKVNGELKTSDGLATNVSDTNAYQQFKVKPQ